MNPLLNIAFKAARAAGKIIVRAFDRLDRITITEKAHNDFVTDIDELAEKEIINIIRKAYPEHAILAEESGQSKQSEQSEQSANNERNASNKKDEYLWIIDPLDGTNNYIHGHPCFSISIAVKYRDKIQCGLVYDPLRQELFRAELGGGAYFNSHRMRVNQCRKLEGSLLGIGFAHSNSHHLKDYITTLSTIELQTAGIRRSGSSALDFAYVACGRLDGIWEFNLKPWDFAAGILLVTEAGGRIGDFHGENDLNKYLETGNIIAGNPEVFKNLQCAIEKCLMSRG